MIGDHKTSINTCMWLLFFGNKSGPSEVFLMKIGRELFPLSLPDFSKASKTSKNLRKGKTLFTNIVFNNCSKICFFLYLLKKRDILEHIYTFAILHQKYRERNVFPQEEEQLLQEAQSFHWQLTINKKFEFKHLINKWYI